MVVSIASSSAKGFSWKWLNVIRAVCGLRSQSLLRQRLGVFRQRSAYSRQPAFPIASSSAKGLPHQQRRAGRWQPVPDVSIASSSAKGFPRNSSIARLTSSICLNRFFISEGIPTQLQTKFTTTTPVILSQSLLHQRRHSHATQTVAPAELVLSQSLLHQRRDSHLRPPEVHQRSHAVSIASSSAKGFESAGARLRIPPAAPNKPAVRAGSPAADSRSATPQVPGLQPPVSSLRSPASAQSLLHQRRDSHRSGLLPIAGSSGVSIASSSAKGFPLKSLESD